MIERCAMIAALGGSLVILTRAARKFVTGAVQGAHRARVGALRVIEHRPAKKSSLVCASRSRLTSRYSQRGSLPGLRMQRCSRVAEL